MSYKEYEIKDHLGNVRLAITDYKLPQNPDPTAQPRGVMPFTVDERSVNDYYPYGMLIPERSYSSSDYRYGYNTQEKSLEIDANGNHTTAEFWEYDARSVKRWNRDPKPITGISDYATFRNNPILYKDWNGDTTFTDKYGKLVNRGKGVDDHLVYLIEGNRIKKIGEIGKSVDVTAIMPNLLKKNSDIVAKGVTSDLWSNMMKFKSLVSTGEDFDLKNDTSTIFGIVWKKEQRKDNKTKFTWQGHYTFDDASSIGNYHAGYIGMYAGIPKSLLFFGAGYAEMSKDWSSSLDKYSKGHYVEGFKESASSLIRGGSLFLSGTAHISLYIMSQNRPNPLLSKILWNTTPLPPAGDRWKDYYWNKKGTEDATK